MLAETLCHCVLQVLVGLRRGVHKVVKLVKEPVVSIVQLLDLLSEAVHLLVDVGEALGEDTLQPAQLLCQLYRRGLLHLLVLLLGLCRPLQPFYSSPQPLKVLRVITGWGEGGSGRGVAARCFGTGGGGEMVVGRRGQPLLASGEGGGWRCGEMSSTFLSF